MKENVLIASALNEHARIYLIDSKNIVEEARRIHDLWPTSCAALGRTLTLTALLSLMQKNVNDSVTVTINGKGPIGTILCVGDYKGNVKGFCGNNQIYLKNDVTNKLAVNEAVGTDGYLKVIRNLKLKQSYTSEVQLQTGEIGEDFAYYLAVSEQIPSLVSVGVLVDKDYSVLSAGGMIIELLPGYSEDDISYLENLSLEPISSVLNKDNDLEKYLNSLFFDAEILDSRSVRYYCDCSSDRFLSKLMALPLKDLQELSSQEKTTVKCEFCNKIYIFDKDDFNKLLGNEN